MSNVVQPNKIGNTDIYNENIKTKENVTSSDVNDKLPKPTVDDESLQRTASDITGSSNLKLETTKIVARIASDTTQANSGAPPIEVQPSNTTYESSQPKVQPPTNTTIESSLPKFQPTITTKESSPPDVQPPNTTNESSPPDVQPPNTTNESSPPDVKPTITTNVSSPHEVQPTNTNIKSSPPKVQPTNTTNESPPPDVQPTNTIYESSPPDVQAPTTTNESSPSDVQPTNTTNVSSPHEVQPTNTTNESSPPKIQPTTTTNESPPREIQPPNTTNELPLPELQPINTTNESSPPEVQPTNTTHKSSPHDVQPTNTTNVTSLPEAQPTNTTNESSPPEVQPPNTSNESSPPEVQPSNTINELSPPEVQPTKTSVESSPQAARLPNTIVNSSPPDNTTNESLPSEVQPTKTTIDSLPPEVQPNTASLETSAKDKEIQAKLDENKHTTSAENEIYPVMDASEGSNAPNTHDHAIEENIPYLPKIQKDTNPQTSSDSQTNTDNKPTQLLNLITQELGFINKIRPKLGKHEEFIKKEAKHASKVFQKLKDEPWDLKELKDLKKTVTKLKLQIPAKYRTYNETDEQNNQQSDEENRGIVSYKLLKRLPRLHDKIFNESPFCKIIQQRYDTLKPESKLCLLCFSVFPENVVISRRLMVYWWIGEGLILLEDYSDVTITYEDCANKVFSELMEKDFIQPISESQGRYVATCKMHPMVRAALVMIADNVNFFDFDEYGNPKDFGKFDEIESPQDVPLISPLSDPREFFDFFDQDKISITSNSIELGNHIQFSVLLPDNNLDLVDRDGKPIDKNKKFYFYRKKTITTRSFKVCLMGSGLSKGITWEKLHMLFNVKDDILELKPEWFLRMKNVNVVFLGRWQSSAAHHIEVEEFNFEESMEHMNHVRFFSLQGVSRISELPNTISKLESLVILDLRACHNLEVISKTIGSLKFLTHLDMSECYLLKDIPKEISSLESLQVFKGFVVVDSPGRHVCTLQDLKKLQNLRKLSMYTHMKDFPQEVHLESLQKFERLRKLTILWGGDESDPQTPNPNKNGENKKNEKLTSKVMKLIPKKQWVKGSIRRMNAFNNSTLGSRLEKLDLKCFPNSVTPNWLTPSRLSGLKKLYIRGGQFSDLGQYQDILEWDDLPKETWNVEILRLKYLDELKMEWRELQNLFPKMTSLEKVKCPRLALFPCNEHGVWIQKTT